MSLSAIRLKNANVKMVGKTAVVVGGTSGIGMGVAMRLAQSGVGVTIVGRNEERAKEIITQMDALSMNKEVKHGFLKCDSFLLNNIVAAVKDYSSRTEHKSLDYLVLSQGMATVQGRTETKEGIDEKLALHYFGRVAFVLNFLPLLRASSSANVLSVLSAGYHSPYANYSDDFELKTTYSLKNAADAAGFYNDIAMDSLARDSNNANIRFSHIAPGFIATNWGTEMPAIIRGLVRIGQMFGRSVNDCAEFMFEALTIAKPGMNLFDQYGQPTPRITPLHNEARESVWTNTINLINRVTSSSFQK